MALGGGGGGGGGVGGGGGGVPASQRGVQRRKVGLCGGGEGVRWEGGCVRRCVEGVATICGAGDLWCVLCCGVWGLWIGAASRRRGAPHAHAEGAPSAPARKGRGLRKARPGAQSTTHPAAQ